MSLSKVLKTLSFSPVLAVLALSTTPNALARFGMTEAISSPSQLFSAMGGDGGAFNGPNMSPVSIPLQLDRGIHLDEAEKAVKICFATGDANHGVKSALQRLYADVFPNSRISSKLRFDAKIYSTGGYDPSEPGFLSIYEAAAFEGNSVSPEVYQKGLLGVAESAGSTLDLDPAKDQFHLYFNKDESTFGCGHPAVTLYGYFEFCTGHIHLVLKPSWPHLVYSQFVDDSVYDQWGELTKKRTLLKDPRIIIAPGTDSVLRFRNDDTQREVDLPSHAQEYVQCLQSELQRITENR